MISQKTKEKIWELREKGLTQPGISSKLKISLASISKWCKEFDPQGKFNKNKKKYNSQKIVDYYLNSKSLKETHLKFNNLTKPRIRQILIERGVYINKPNLSLKQKKRNNSLNVINWKKRKKIELVKYKGGKCEICGYNKCIEALEFHHKDPTQKDFGLSNTSTSFKKMKKEVDKCLLVCANCHREIHYKIKNNQD